MTFIPFFVPQLVLSGGNLNAGGFAKVCNGSPIYDVDLKLRGEYALGGGAYIAGMLRWLASLGFCAATFDRPVGEGYYVHAESPSARKMPACGPNLPHGLMRSWLEHIPEALSEIRRDVNHFRVGPYQGPGVDGIGSPLGLAGDRVSLLTDQRVASLFIDWWWTHLGGDLFGWDEVGGGRFEDYARFVRHRPSHELHIGEWFPPPAYSELRRTMHFTAQFSSLNHPSWPYSQLRALPGERSWLIVDAGNEAGVEAQCEAIYRAEFGIGVYVGQWRTEAVVKWAESRGLDLGRELPQATGNGAPIIATA